MLKCILLKHTNDNYWRKRLDKLNYAKCLVSLLCIVCVPNIFQIKYLSYYFTRHVNTLTTSVIIRMF